MRAVCLWDTRNSGGRQGTSKFCDVVCLLEPLEPQIISEVTHKSGVWRRGEIGKG